VTAGVGGIRTLVLDIETRPHLAHVWKLWDENVGLSQLIEAGTVISFAAKWHGRKKVEFRSDFHHGHDVMVARSHELVDEADAVVHFNGRAFDMKHLRREWVKAGFGPPSPWHDVDLLSVVRRNFKFPSNRLVYVLDELDAPPEFRKLETGGHSLWRRCLEGDRAAWAQMRRYNIGDIHATEWLYDRLLPWIGGHPHVGMFDGRPDGCQNCGSTDLIRKGVETTKVSVYKRWLCKACGKWNRSTRRDSGVDIRSAA
jgi:hypothetical protein